VVLQTANLTGVVEHAAGGGPGDDLIFIAFPAHLGSPITVQILNGGDGNDMFNTSPEVILSAGAGDDIIHMTYKRDGITRIRCGAGTDVAHPNIYGVPPEVFTGCEAIEVLA
jgi:hypothetical protein